MGRVTGTRGAVSVVAAMAAAMTVASNASAYKPHRSPDQRERNQSSMHPDGTYAVCGHTAGGSPTSSPVSCAMGYGQGQVISNVQVVPVFWTYGGKTVNSTVMSWAPSYMGALVDSAYLDLLSEYSTKGQSGGTNQTITRGTITKPYTITPISATGASIDDSQIAGELAAQVAASKLPAVTLDSTSNPNTLYVLFFPTGVTITEGGGASCTEFCGYHGSGTSGSSTYLYAVIPDLSQVQTYTLGDGGSVTEPCGYGCSYDAPAKPEVDWFNGTVSHEIGEAVTDPVNGSGWYDQSNTDFACAGSKSQNQPGGGEIGDVCVGYYDDEYTSGECEDTQKVAGTNINAQITWSNKLDGCYSGNPSVAPQCPPSGCYDGGPGPFDPGADAGSGSGSGSSSGGSSSGGGSGDASVSDDAGSGSGSGGGSGSGSGGGSGSGSGGGSGGSSGGESSSSGGGSGGGSGGASGGGVSPDAGSGNGDTGGSSNSAGGCNSASSPGGAGSPLAVGGALMALGAVLRRRKRGA